MKLRIFCTALVLVLVGVSIAAADDRGSGVSRSTLQSLGYGHMKILSDAEGRTVRGQGVFGRAFGTGTVGAETKTYDRPLNPNRAAGFHIVTSGKLFAAGGSFAAAR